MADFRAVKQVATLPTPLVADTVYMVRAGTGFDLYVTDTTGAIAHRLNADVIAKSVHKHRRMKGDFLKTDGWETGTYFVGEGVTNTPSTLEMNGYDSHIAHIFTDLSDPVAPATVGPSGLILFSMFTGNITLIVGEKTSEGKVKFTSGSYVNRAHTPENITGKLTDLTTTAKTNLVAAINELQSAGGGSGTAQLSAQQLKDFEQMRRYAGVSGALASVPLSVTKSPHTPTSKTVSLVADVNSWHATATPATQLILEWGDGQTETVAITAPQATHTHTYAAVGNYTVTVKTDDPYHGVGSPQTVAYTVVEDIVPTATISVGLISSTATATVGATTSYAGQPYTVEIDWGIGAGWTSTTSHNYAVTGTYTVQARVTTTGGTSAIVTENVTIAATSSAPTTWTITQSSVYSGTTAATQANMHTNSGTYPAGCYTNSGSPAHMTATFPAMALVTSVKLKACNEPAQNEGWDESYLNGATLQYTTDGTTWTNVATVSGHTSGETAFKDYPVNQNCLGVRVQVSGYLAIGQFTIV